MKRLLGILGTLLLALSAQSVLGANTEWRTVFFEDFGGNNTGDPKMKKEGLPKENVGSHIEFAPFAHNGKYQIVKYSDTNLDRWHWGGDHTHLNDTTRGYYMRIDPPGSKSDDVMYRKKLEGVCKGVKFRFTTWIASMSKDVGEERADVSLGIFSDGDAKTLVSKDAYKRLKITSLPDLNSMSLNWELIEMEFEMGGDADEAFFIVSAYQAYEKGFDFAIDDIKVEVEQPAVTITGSNFVKGETAELKAWFDNSSGYFADPSSVIYKWQYRPSANDEYADLSGSEGRWKEDNRCTYKIPDFDKKKHNGEYRVIIGENSTMDNEICSVRKDYTVQAGDTIRVMLCRNGEAREVTHNGHTFTTIEPKGNIPSGYAIDISYDESGKLLDDPFTAVFLIIDPKVETRPDTFLCIGSTVNGVKYDKAQTVKVDSVIKSKDPECNCDSIIYTQNYVITDSTLKTMEAVDICQGEKHNGKTYHEAGTDSELREEGCVRLLTPIIVHPTYEREYTYSLCQGSLFDGEMYNEAGSFAKTIRYKSVYGCDSVINATIDVKGEIVVNLEDVEMCEGSDVYSFDGKIYTSAGQYDLSERTTSALSGCDSVTNVRVVIHPRYDNRNNPIDTMICYDSKLFGNVYPEPTTTPILVKDPTNYTTIHGCDSIIYYNLEVLKIQLKLEISSDKNTVCMGEEVEIFVKDLKPVNTPLTWIPDLGGASSNRKNFTPTEDMVCVVRARNDIAQCETTDTARIYVKASPSIAIDTLDEKNNIVAYSVTSGTEPFHIYLNKNEVSMEPNGEIKNSPIGSHKLMVKDSSNCSSSVTFDIHPVPITPNGFMTPNNDGENDTWTIENIEVYPLSRVRIYNRDGRLIAEYEAYDNNNGFNGTYQGNPLPSTDYWYEIDLVEADRQYVGHFTLIR